MAENAGFDSKSNGTVAQHVDKIVTPSTSPWNSLEKAKLAASILLPLVLLVLGVFVTQSEKHAQALTDARIKSYDAIKKDINRIHCYIEDVGTWKEDTPDTITEFRRDAEQELYEEQPIWSEKTFAAFTRYMDQIAFKTNTGVAKDAQIRTTTIQKSTRPNWNPTWADRFTDPVSDDDYNQAYKQMIDSFGHDITH